MASEDENPWGQSGRGSKLSRRMSEKIGGTKDVASTGFKKAKAVAAVGFKKTKVVAKKVKVGALIGVNWIKVKCQNRKLFQKK